MRPRSCLSALALGCLALVAVPPAAARERRGHAPPPAPVPLAATARKAAELTEQAYEAQRDGRWNDALSLYERALEMDPLPKRHRNLAIALEQAGRWAEALRHYGLFQRDEQGEPPEHRQDVAERVARLLPRLGRVEISTGPPLAAAPPDEPVSVQVAEAGGDRPRCVAPPDGAAAGSYLCQPGTVTAELLIAGHVVASRPVLVAAGATARATFPLRAPVRLSGNRPKPDLLVDSVPLRLPGSLPQTVPLLLGAHELTARDGRDVLHQRFVVREGQTGAVELRFPTSRRWVYWVVGGVAVAVAAVGAGVTGYLVTRPAPAGGPDVTLPPPK